MTAAELNWCKFGCSTRSGVHSRAGCAAGDRGRLGSQACACAWRLRQKAAHELHWAECGCCMQAHTKALEAHLAAEAARGAERGVRLQAALERARQLEGEVAALKAAEALAAAQHRQELDGTLAAAAAAAARAEEGRCELQRRCVAPRQGAWLTDLHRLTCLSVSWHVSDAARRVPQHHHRRHQGPGRRSQAVQRRITSPWQVLAKSQTAEKYSLSPAKGCSSCRPARHAGSKALCITAR